MPCFSLAAQAARKEAFIIKVETCFNLVILLSDRSFTRLNDRMLLLFHNTLLNGKCYNPLSVFYRISHLLSSAAAAEPGRVVS